MRYEMRFLTSEYRADLNWHTETYIIHHAGDPGRSVCQVEFYQPVGSSRWLAWLGSSATRSTTDLRRAAEETRNALA